MLHKVGERVVNRLLGDQVIIVHDQDGLLRLFRETVEERSGGACCVCR
jgi:hypothetical protein